eukprot:188684-Chlamydomonas_euryale.AAC.1
MEYRYAAVAFAPAAIQAYSGTLEATVQGGSDPATKAFTCEVRGEGTLPSLSLQAPDVFDTSGRPVLRFGRVLVGRTKMMKINLKNNGTMDVTARLEAPPPECGFRMLEVAPQTFTTEPKRAQTFSVEFAPQCAGACEGVVNVKVFKNPFEDYRVACIGEGYQDDVTFEKLPGDSADELRLADCPVGVPVSHVLVLHNHARGKAFRFAWPDASTVGIRVSPSAGFLLPGACKDVTLTYTPTARAKLAPHELKLALVGITPAAGGGDATDLPDWDDRSTVLDYGASAAGAGGGGQPVARPEPQPKVADVPGSAKDMLLK